MFILILFVKIVRHIIMDVKLNKIININVIIFCVPRFNPLFFHTTFILSPLLAKFN